MGIIQNIIKLFSSENSIYYNDITFNKYLNYGPIIEGSLAKWKNRNPRAIFANISNRTDLTDDDFIHLKDVRILNMSNCNQTMITDNAFKFLGNVHTLNMSNCNQKTITNNAFKHLYSIQNLDITNCNQPTITNIAFQYLINIKNLYMRGCNKKTIDEECILYLTNIETLKLSFKTQRKLIAKAELMGIMIDIPHKYKNIIEKEIIKLVMNII